MPTRHTVTDWVSAVLITTILAGCAPPLHIHQASDASVKQGVPLNKGLAYGRIVVRGWSSTVRADYATSVEFRNRATGQAFTHRLNGSGEFHWLLYAGGYEITDIWSGFERVSQQAKDHGIHFHVPAGGVAYLGELFVQLPSLYSKGTVKLLDDYAMATRYLRRRFPSLKLEEAPAKHLFSIPRARK